MLNKKYLLHLHLQLVDTSNGSVLRRDIKSCFHEGKIAVIFTSRIQFSNSKILKGITVKALPL